MPEGDVVFRTCRRLHHAMCSQIATLCDIRVPRHATTDLTGYRLLEVDSYGNHIMMRFAQDAQRMSNSSNNLKTCISPLKNQITVHSHLKMEGSWHLIATNNANLQRVHHNPAVRALIGTSQWTAVGYSLGRLDVVATQHEHQIIGHLGPDILASTWSAADIANQLACADAYIGSALLDQQLTAGIGTFYMSEGLFVHGISPWTPCQSVNNAAELLTTIRDMMAANCHRAVQTTTGNTRPGYQSYVHGRSGRPCRRCHNPVRVAMIDTGANRTASSATQQRTAFYCPHCQHGLAPSDDGKPQRPLGAERNRSQLRRGRHAPGRQVARGAERPKR